MTMLRIVLEVEVSKEPEIFPAVLPRAWGTNRNDRKTVINPLRVEDTVHTIT